MTRTLQIGLALMGLAACGMAKGEEPAANANLKPTSGSRAAASPATRSLPIGTTIGVTLDETITSRNNQAGETVTSTVDSDLKDAAGRIVIPAGSVLALTIVEITPAKNKSQEDGTLVLQVSSVRVRDRSYPLTGEITSLSHTLKGRGVTAGEVEKVAVGTAVGAVAGRIIGGNAKGTIIGAAIGAAGGTVVAVHTASRDVVVAAGTPVGITLTGPFTVASP
jgi:hypothetical protein